MTDKVPHILTFYGCFYTVTSASKSHNQFSIHNLCRFVQYLIFGFELPRDCEGGTIERKGR